jgi:hypothetical protein
VRYKNKYILIGIHEGKKPRGRPKHKRKYNIKMDFKELMCEIVGWINLIQDGK